MIPLFRPDITDEESNAVAEVLRSRWTGLGPNVEAFEHEWAEVCGKRYAVALNSGTSALEFAFSMARKYGQSYSIPVMTWPGLYHHVHAVGGDIDVYGNGTVYGSISNHGGQQGKTPRFIDDCAHMHPAKRKYLSVIQCWSLHSVKCISCGDGGMVTTDCPDIADACKKWRWFGIDKTTYDRASGKYSWEYDIKCPGGKHHMNDITAAIGRVQLRRWPEMEQKRRDMLRNVYGVDQEGLHLYQVKCHDEAHRAAVCKHLDKHGIGYGMHYQPIWEFSQFSQWRTVADEYPVAQQWGKTVLTLPLGSAFSEQEQAEIAKAVETMP